MKHNPPPAREIVSYPCRWLFKIIGTDRASLEAAAAQVTGAENTSMRFSNMSSKGSYLSFNVEIEVESREQRDALYVKFKAHPAVKAIL